MDRVTQWQEFAKKVADHVKSYAVKQYGDAGDDLVSGAVAWKLSPTLPKVRK